MLRLAGTAHARLPGAHAHALDAPHGTVTTKTVHQWPQPGRICQSSLADVHSIITFRLQPSVFHCEPHHMHPKARRLRLCLNRCFLQYIHAALQMVNPLLEAPLFLAEACHLGRLEPWLRLHALLDSCPCSTGHLGVEVINRALVQGRSSHLAHRARVLLML